MSTILQQQGMSASACQSSGVAWGKKRSGLLGQTSVNVMNYEDSKLIYLSLQSLLFHYNVQHDCYHGHCQASGVRQLKQERILSGKNALHNAHLLRGILPRELVRPLPFAVDRISHHRNAVITQRILSRLSLALQRSEKGLKLRKVTNNLKKEVLW